MLKKGQILEVEITDIGVNAEGIAHISDYTVFVPFALVGEKVRAEIVHIPSSKPIAFAKLVEVLMKSKHRIEPVCKYFLECGGCDYLHLDYKEQLKYKRNSVINTLSKMVKVPFQVEEVVPSIPNMGYRNKVQLPFGVVKGKVVLGFYKKGSNDICPIDECLLHGSWLTPIMKATLDYVNDNKIRVYFKGKGLLRHLVIRNIDSNICVTLVSTSKNLPNINSFYDALNAIYKNTSLYININKEPTNVIMGNETFEIKNTPQSLSVMGIKTSLNPLSFFQVNDNIREKLYEDVIKIINPSEQTIVIDAYSGVGIMGAIMAKSGARIINIDEISEAIDDANILYKLNGIDHKAYNICGDSTFVLPRLAEAILVNQSHRALDSSNDKLASNDSEESIKKASSIFQSYNDVVVLLDPPRKGVSEEVIVAIEKLKTIYPSLRVVYISCNPATLARDLAKLTSFLNIKSIVPYDMFAQTKHLEALCYLAQ